MLPCIVCFKGNSLGVQGSYGQGKSGKTERVREKSGNFKIPLTIPIIYALFSQFLSASGGVAPRPGLRPCKHCRLVYFAIFYNGTKFSITFVYLVLFYWCRE